MSGMIETDRLTKVYSSGTQAVEEVTFQVSEGEIFGFLGPNGAGKSSTIKMLTTLSRPTSGSARVSGFDVLKEAKFVRASIGYVAQETGVDYVMSGRENLRLQGHLYRLSSSQIRERTEALLEFFEIQDAGDRMVSTYSGGMRRKLDIATALIHQPRLLFLDEPTLGLDPQSRMNLWDFIRRLNESFQVTIFLSTHYLDEADRLAHRVGIIDQGRIRVIGTPDGLKDEIKGDSVNLSFEQLNGSQKATVSGLRGEPFVKDLLEEGQGVRIYVANGAEAIPQILSSLHGKNLEVKSVTLSRPSLDDVFLKYTGKRIEASEASDDGNPWWAKWQKGGSWGGQKGDWQKWQGKEDSNKEGTDSTSREGEWEGQKNWGEASKEWNSRPDQWKEQKGGEPSETKSNPYWKADAER